MCGIVGYTGPREAGPVLLEGLRRLEYRGYDSAGIALVTESGDLFVEKRAGKVAVLTDALGSGPPSAGVGLGHTRWATHGRPSDLNAHPHSDCSGRITVVHNGVIENCDRLKHTLAAEGHVFLSATDTEVLAHLIGKHYQEKSRDGGAQALTQASAQALPRLECTSFLATRARPRLEYARANLGSRRIASL